MANGDASNDGETDQGPMGPAGIRRTGESPRRGADDGLARC